MDKIELLDKLADTLGNVNAPIQAHQQIQGTIDRLKRKVQQEQAQQEAKEN